MRQGKDKDRYWSLSAVDSKKNCGVVISFKYKFMTQLICSKGILYLKFTQVLNKTRCCSYDYWFIEYLIYNKGDG